MRQPMSSAPHDRPILLESESKYITKAYERYQVAQYAAWDKTGPYQFVWETGGGECVDLDDPDLIGWHELPED